MRNCAKGEVRTVNGMVRVEIPMFFCVVSPMVLISSGTNSGTDPDFGAYSLTVS